MTLNKKRLTPFLDLLFCLLMVFLCMIMLVKVTTKTEKEAAFQQNVVYQIVLNWQGNNDFDLWGQDPKGRIVSFNRREGGEGSLFSLNRDNLGRDKTELDEFGFPVVSTNEEIVSIRGVISGEYIFNVHNYNHRDQGAVRANVRLIKVKPFKEILMHERDFLSSGEQYTFFRFILDKDENVTANNTLQANLVYNQ